MIGLPEIGARVKVWPAPGLRVQNGPRPIGDGGRWLAPGGEVVVWSQSHLEQLRGGELLLHPPPCEEHEHPKGNGDEPGACENCGRSVKEANEYDAQAIPARKKLPTKAKPEQKAAPELFDPHKATEEHMKAMAKDEPEKPATPAAASSTEQKPDTSSKG